MKYSFRTSPSKWFYFIFHPFTLALLISLVSAWFVFPKFEAYKAELIDKERLSNTVVNSCYFADLNQDGTSERIHIFEDEKSPMTSVVIGLGNRKANIDQYNYNGKLLKYGRVLLGDYNNNTFDEIYSFTRLGDSLFLNITEALLKTGIDRRQVYLGQTKAYSADHYDVELVGGELQDVNQDGYKELLFVFHGGYSMQPRNFYVYDVKNNHLTVSPESGSGPKYNVQFKDLDNDGFPEVTGHSGATFNFHSTIAHPDSSCWLMIYSKDGHFLFPPKEFPLKHSNLNSTFIHFDEQDYILSLYRKPNIDKELVDWILYLHDVKGNLLKEKKIAFSNQVQSLFLLHSEGDDRPLIYSDKGRFYKIDQALKLHLINQHELEDGELIGGQNASLFDLDADDKSDYIFQSNRDHVVIVSADLKHLTTLPVFDNTSPFASSVRKINGETFSLGLSTQNYFLEYRYYKNLYAWLKYPLVILIFLLSYLLFFVLVKTQKHQLEKRLEEQKKIQQFQFRGLRNQLDPHFSLNIINAIQSLFYSNNTEKARLILAKYGKLNRNALQNADKIAISLEEELDFVENYLALEKFRYEERFDYHINIDKDIDAEKIMLPRMLLHTFAENAIKHGLFPKENGGLLKIEITKKENEVFINIEDNGIGRAKSKELKTTNNGKGLNIIKEIVQLYNKLKQNNIRYQTIDLFAENEAIGTRIEIYLPLKEK